MMTRLTVIVGAYGSGKTEVAINYALRLRADGKRVNMVDLDIVNPFFRSRDIRDYLAGHDIQVISSNEGLETADIPALSPKILGLLQDRDYDGIFDVGGDPAGATALGRFNRYFQQEPYNLWVVVNPFRPDSSDAQQVFEMVRAIENASRLKATGLIDNTNLGSATTVQDRLAGREVVRLAATLLKLPIVWRTVSDKYPPEKGDDHVPSLPLTLYMKPLWMD